MYSTDVFSRLKQLLDVDTQQEFFNAASSILGCPLFYIDASISVTMYSQSFFDMGWQKWIQDTLSLSSPSEELLEIVRTVGVSSRRCVFDHGLYECVVCPVVVEEEKHGYFVCWWGSTANTSASQQLLELVAEMYKSLLLRLNISFNQEPKLYDRVLIRLLNNEPVADELVARLPTLLDWKPKIYYHVLCCKANSLSIETDAQALIQGLGKYCEHKLLRYGSRILLIYTSDEYYVDWLPNNPALLELNELLIRHNFIAGISNPFSELKRISRYYRQAVAAANIATFDIPRLTMFPFSGFGPECLLNQWQDSGGDASDFVQPKLNVITEYDKANGTELMKTLDTWLVYSMSYGETAKAMYLHTNTVRYRIERCQKLMGFDVWESDFLFKLMLSNHAAAFGRLTSVGHCTDICQHII